jgi:hypothetical protein
VEQVRASDVTRPFPYNYYVFGSRTEEPTPAERGSGAYLVGTAEERHLQAFFDPLYETLGIGIASSEDEVIAGKEKLDALAKALAEAIADVRARPERWPMIIGQRLVAEIVRSARQDGGVVHFGGGR